MKDIIYIVLSVVLMIGVYLENMFKLYPLNVLLLVSAIVLFVGVLKDSRKKEG